MLRDGPRPDSRRFLTPSNLLSISRILLCIPFVLVMLSEIPHARVWALLIVGAGALTDKLDGMLARRHHQITQWGKILDPLADKIGVAVLALVLLSTGDLPLWFVVTMLVRDLLIFAGGMYVKARKGIVLPSNETGKWAVGMITLTLALALMQVGGTVMSLLIGASLVMLTLSLYQYVVRFAHVIGTKQGTDPHGIS